MQELFVEFVPQTSNAIWNFSAESQPAICKNTTDNLLSSKPTVFIITSKGVRSIKKHYDQLEYIYTGISIVRNYTPPANTYFSFDSDKSRRIIL